MNRLITDEIIELNVDQLSNIMEGDGSKLKLAQHFIDSQFIIEHSGDIILKHSYNGYIKFISSAAKRLLMFENKQMMNKNYFDFIHHDDVERVKHVIQINKNKSPFTLVYRLKKKAWWLFMG